MTADDGEVVVMATKRTGRRRPAVALVMLTGALAILGAQCTPEPTKLTVAAYVGSATPDGPGGSEATQGLTVYNDGQDPIKLTLGEESPQFRLEYAAHDFACDSFLWPNGRSLDPGETCTVEAEFDPSSPGLHRTTLVITGHPGGNDTVELQGYAV